MGTAVRIVFLLLPTAAFLACGCSDGQPQAAGEPDDLSGQARPSTPGVEPAAPAPSQSDEATSPSETGPAESAEPLPPGHQVIALYQAGKLPEARKALLDWVGDSAEAAKRTEARHPIDLESKLGHSAAVNLVVYCFRLDRQARGRAKVPPELLEAAKLARDTMQGAIEETKRLEAGNSPLVTFRVVQTRQYAERQLADLLVQELDALRELGRWEDVKELGGQYRQLLKAHGLPASEEPPISEAPPTPIELAVRSGNVAELKRLLQTDPKAVTAAYGARPPGDTLLHMAARLGRKEIAEMLISRGADPMALNGGGCTPLDGAEGRKDIGDLLMAHGAADTGPLHKACQANDATEVTRLLNEHPTLVNCHEASTRRAPLHWAVSHGNRQLTEWLLAQGASVDAKASRDRTPLHLAVEKKATHIAALLIGKSATVDARDDLQRTPLHVAARYGTEELVAVLLRHGADANAKSAEGETPLHFAVLANNKASAKRLIAAGADVTANTRVNWTGWTPLHFGVVFADREMVELLLAAGAPVDVKNEHGDTPLDLAKKRRPADGTIELLQKAQEARRRNLEAESQSSTGEGELSTDPFKRQEKPMSNVLMRLAALAALAGGASGCAPEPGTTDAVAEKVAQVKQGMTKAEVLAIVGKPVRKSDDVLPEQFFVGAPAPYDSPMLNAKKEYETWYYHTQTSIVRFWFSHPTAPKEEWVVIGSTSTSKGGEHPL
jgi:ankyrin repeat protein